jgi:hypothetical protein
MKKASKTKKSFQAKELIFPFEHCSNKVSLSYFQDWCNRHIPVGAKDLCIELKTVSDPEDWGIKHPTNTVTNLVLSWKQEVKK